MTHFLIGMGVALFAVAVVVVLAASAALHYAKSGHTKLGYLESAYIFAAVTVAMASLLVSVGFGMWATLATCPLWQQILLWLVVCASALTPPARLTHWWCRRQGVTVDA